MFRNQPEPEISLYLVSSDQELRRVTIGLNANRSSLKESLEFVTLLPATIERYGIGVNQTPGDLKCGFANRLHFDATATDQQLEALCRELMAAKQLVAKLTKGMMKLAAEEANEQGCAAATVTPPCRITECGS